MKEPFNRDVESRVRVEQAVDVALHANEAKEGDL